MGIWEQPEPDRRDEQVAMVKNRALRTLIWRCLKQAPEARPSMEDIIGELEQPMLDLFWQDLLFYSHLQSKKKAAHKP